MEVVRLDHVEMMGTGFRMRTQEPDAIIFCGIVGPPQPTVLLQYRDCVPGFLQ